MEVFEPPLMCVTVPKTDFINAVESCFGAAQLKVSDIGRTVMTPYISSSRRPLLLSVKRTMIFSTIVLMTKESLGEKLVSPLGSEANKP